MLQDFCIFFQEYVIIYLKYYGDFSEGAHLFPFRTEKLSPPAQMVLHNHVVEYVVAVFHDPDPNRSGFFLPYIFNEWKICK